MKSEFLLAITQLAAERNLSQDVVLHALESALLSAYRKDNPGAPPNLEVKIHPDSGEIVVHTVKVVVDEVTDSAGEMSQAEARRVKRDAAVGDIITVASHVIPAGRIAAQTAKQVVMQRLREAEREVVYDEFLAREGEVLPGVVQRMDPRHVTVDLGRTEAILPASEQVLTEAYRPGVRLKFYLLEVQRSSRGPQIILSRTHRNLLRRLLEMEVPEIYHGTVEIKAIAREPGQRSKVAVAALADGVDPVGCCVGLRGIRIQNVVNELKGEKIDIVQWHPSIASFIGSALSPAPVIRVDTDEEQRVATVVVPDRQLSLAIGKDGQNARLAARLTGWRIDIKSASQVEAERPAPPVEAAPPPAEVEEAAPEAALEVEVAPATAEVELVPEIEVPLPLAEVAQSAPVEEVEVVEVEVEGLTSLEEALAPLASISRESDSSTPQIRFAEDIMGGRFARGAGKKKRGRKGEPGVAAKPKRRSVRSVSAEDDTAVEGEP